MGWLSAGAGAAKEEYEPAPFSGIGSFGSRSANPLCIRINCKRYDLATCGIPTTTSADEPKRPLTLPGLSCSRRLFARASCSVSASQSASRSASLKRSSASRCSAS